jgi:hypothetical protein
MLLMSAAAMGQTHKPKKVIDPPVECIADGVACNKKVELLPKPETKPADITALMEKLAPTPKWVCTTEVTETRITTVCVKQVPSE